MSKISVAIPARAPARESRGRTANTTTTTVTARKSRRAKRDKATTRANRAGENGLSEDEGNGEEDEEDEEDDDAPPRSRSARGPDTPASQKTPTRTRTASSRLSTPRRKPATVAIQDSPTAATTPARPRSRRTAATPTTTTPAVATTTPRARQRQAADRSARRKTTRSILERAVQRSHRDGDDDDDDDDGAEALAREICASSDDDDAAADADATEPPPPPSLDSPSPVSATPTRQRPRGRPRGSAATTAAATPATATPKTTPRPRRPAAPRSPPRHDLPPHERFFLDNKPGRPRTSDLTLGGAGVSLLSHDEYFAVLPPVSGPVLPALAADMLAHSFPQWGFELQQGFGLCLYGLGCKRAVLRRFARFLALGWRHDRVPPRMVMVNGHARKATTRDILLTVWAALRPGHKPPSTGLQAAIRAAAAAAAGTRGTSRRDSSADDDDAVVVLVVLVNSIDAGPLRRAAGAQAALAVLAAMPGVRLACTADTPDFALLWDAGRRAALALVFHDCTTLRPPGWLDPVDDVHELLGRRARRAPTRDAVRFVLRSLPDKARQMFRLLVAEVLLAAAANTTPHPSAPVEDGVEARRLYAKAVEEFICGNEISFRTLLKEFHDHDMIVSRTDAVGTEILALPFTRDEVEAIMEDLCDGDGE